ncbi:MAG: hypothetical protein KDJ65_13065 [Anaerolineae bacterium]|nr:hypothetical protein [Anaerolineae bacterium]
MDIYLTTPIRQWQSLTHCQSISLACPKTLLYPPVVQENGPTGRGRAIG